MVLLNVYCILYLRTLCSYLATTSGAAIVMGASLSSGTLLPIGESRHENLGKGAQLKSEGTISEGYISEGAPMVKIKILH